MFNCEVMEMLVKDRDFQSVAEFWANKYQLSQCKTLNFISLKLQDLYSYRVVWVLVASAVHSLII